MKEIIHVLMITTMLACYQDAPKGNESLPETTINKKDTSEGNEKIPEEPIITQGVPVESNNKLLKDIDFDNIIDTTYLDFKRSTIVCKLSSKDYQKVESKPIEALNPNSGIDDAENGFIFKNHSMRGGYSTQFNYDEKTKSIQLVEISRYSLGNAMNDGSGESSVNLLTDKYIGDWNYFDYDKDELIGIPSIRTGMYLGDIFLKEFSESTYFSFAEACAKLFHRFKDIDINSRSLIDNNNKASIYKEFKPEQIADFQIPGFSINDAFQLNAFKIVSGYYEPHKGQMVVPDTETDWGYRVLVLNTKNEILFKSRGVGDVYLFESHFYKSDESEKIIIIYQLGYEYYFGGEAFVFENGSINSIGLLDIEADSEEKKLTEIVEIKDKGNRIIFSFKADFLILEPGSEDILIRNDKVEYIFENKKLKLVKDIK